MANKEARFAKTIEAVDTAEYMINNRFPSIVVFDENNIDLSPIEFDYIDYEDKRLRFKKRLVLTPNLDESGQLYVVNHPEFDLETFAYTRQEIIDGIKSDIRFLWNGYAKAADEVLTKDAQELKQKLLSSIEEIINV